VTPGLSVYRSNRLEVLVELLAWLTQQPGQRPADPIAPLRVAVGNVGMAGWLEHRLAERWGVLANVELMFPARAFAEVERSVLGDAAPAPDADPWAPGALTWTVLEVLAEVQGDAHPDFAPLRDYLGADPHAARAKGGAATARATSPTALRSRSTGPRDAAPASCPPR
jgi:exonuclease V gamma subunit